MLRPASRLDGQHGSGAAAQQARMRRAVLLPPRLGRLHLACRPGARDSSSSGGSASEEAAYTAFERLLGGGPSNPRKAATSQAKHAETSRPGTPASKDASRKWEKAAERELSQRTGGLFLKPDPQAPRSLRKAKEKYMTPEMEAAREEALAELMADLLAPPKPVRAQPPPPPLARPSRPGGFDEILPQRRASRPPPPPAARPPRTPALAAPPSRTADALRDHIREAGAADAAEPSASGQRRERQQRRMADAYDELLAQGLSQQEVLAMLKAAVAEPQAPNTVETSTGLAPRPAHRKPQPQPQEPAAPPPAAAASLPPALGQPPRGASLDQRAAAKPATVQQQADRHPAPAPAQRPRGTSLNQRAEAKPAAIQQPVGERPVPALAEPPQARAVRPPTEPPAPEQRAAAAPELPQAGERPRSQRQEPRAAAKPQPAKQSLATAAQQRPAPDLAQPPRGISEDQRAPAAGVPVAQAEAAAASADPVMGRPPRVASLDWRATAQEAAALQQEAAEERPPPALAGPPRSSPEPRAPLTPPSHSRPPADRVADAAAAGTRGPAVNSSLNGLSVEAAVASEAAPLPPPVVKPPPTLNPQPAVRPTPASKAAGSAADISRQQETADSSMARVLKVKALAERLMKEGNSVAARATSVHNKGVILFLPQYGLRGFLAASRMDGETLGAVQAAMADRSGSVLLADQQEPALQLLAERTLQVYVCQVALAPPSQPASRLDVRFTQSTEDWAHDQLYQLLPLQPQGLQAAAGSWMAADAKVVQRTAEGVLTECELMTPEGARVPLHAPLLRSGFWPPSQQPQLGSTVHVTCHAAGRRGERLYLTMRPMAVKEETAMPEAAVVMEALKHLGTASLAGKLAVSSRGPALLPQVRVDRYPRLDAREQPLAVVRRGSLLVSHDRFVQRVEIAEALPSQERLDILAAAAGESLREQLGYS